MKKYELTDEKLRKHWGKTLFRIKALRDFGDVKTGDLGGFVEEECNLSHYGVCWVYNNAQVYDDAYIHDNAKIFDNVEVSEGSKIGGSTWVRGDVKIDSNAFIDEGCIS